MLLQNFFNTNQLKGKQTFDDYFANILGRQNAINRVDQKLTPNLGETVKFMTWITKDS